MWITPNAKRAPVKLTSPWTFKPRPEVDNVWSFRVGRWNYHCHHWCRLSDWSYGKITETLFLLSVVTHFPAWKVYKFYHLWGWAAFKGIREGCFIISGTYLWDTEYISQWTLLTDIPITQTPLKTFLYPLYLTFRKTDSSSL